jgi:NTP pyrophosphatase (non-canonical NTP hydrolase)
MSMSYGIIEGPGFIIVGPSDQVAEFIGKIDELAQEIEDQARREVIFALIDAERQRQDEKHGRQDHVPQMVLNAVLVEEVGEVSKALLEASVPHVVSNLKEELVQVAAVAVKWLELLDRA